jgi:MFS family permease
VLPSPRPLDRGLAAVIWTLAVGAFGLAWSITTVAAYVPPLLGKFTDSSTLIALVMALEGILAVLLPPFVGPLSDATVTSLGRRRPFMVLALLPMAVTLSLVAFMHSLPATALALLGFFFAYYLYEPPYRGLYPDLLPADVFGRAQGAQHVLRGAALGGALVGGGFLLDVWEPFPFILAAGVVLTTCGWLIVRADERIDGPRQHERLRTHFAAPWRIVKKSRDVRRFLIANTAWEATFAGMRTFVVLYVIAGLGEPLYVSSLVLAAVAGGYVVSAAVSGWFGDQFGLGRVITGASVVYGFGLIGAGLATRWHHWYLGLIFFVAIAGGTVMTLAWGLLFKLMPPGDRGAIAGLATMTKGIGLIVGPLAVGAAIDISSTFLEATDGYAAVWPACGIPIVAAIPLAVLLARAEQRSGAGVAAMQPV